MTLLFGFFFKASILLTQDQLILAVVYLYLLNSVYSINGSLTHCFFQKEPPSKLNQNEEKGHSDLRSPIEAPTKGDGDEAHCNTKEDKTVTESAMKKESNSCKLKDITEGTWPITVSLP